MNRPFLFRSINDVQVQTRFSSSGAASEDTMSQMRRLFGQVGGLVSADALCVRLQCHSDQPISLLARWIVNREIVNFEACGQRWLPIFQFAHGTVARRPGPQRALGELRSVMDDFEISEWFVAPSAWLDGRLPGSLGDEDEDELVHAARGDRYLLAS